MSQENELPSQEDLRKLPRFSIAVYALRCALRVQPLLVSWKNPIKEYKEAVVKLKAAFHILASSHAAEAFGSVAKAVRAADDAATYAGAFYPIAYSAARAAADAAETFYSVAANDSTSATRTATRTIISTGASDFDVDAAARVDYTRLLELETEVTDASETGPLGNLWQGSPPEWYLEAKKQYDTTIAEWEQEFAIDDDEPISAKSLDVEQVKYEIIIQVPAEEDDETAIINTKKLVTYIDELHKSKGGSGVKIDLLEIFESQDAPVPTSPEGM